MSKEACVSQPSGLIQNIRGQTVVCVGFAQSRIWKKISNNHPCRGKSEGPNSSNMRSKIEVNIYFSLTLTRVGVVIVLPSITHFAFFYILYTVGLPLDCPQTVIGLSLAIDGGNGESRKKLPYCRRKDQGIVSVGFAVSRVSHNVHPKTVKMTSYRSYRCFCNFLLYVKYMKKDMRILFSISESFENCCFI